MKSRTKGSQESLIICTLQQRDLNNHLNMKKYFIDRANHEFYNFTLQQIKISRQTFRMKSKSRGTLYFIKDFTFKDKKTFKIHK